MSGGATAYTSGEGRFALTLAAGTYTLAGTAAGCDTGTALLLSGRSGDGFLRRRCCLAGNGEGFGAE